MRKSLQNLGSILFAICLSVEVLAQTGTISGQVIDAKTLEPLPFGNVFINNTTLGVITELDGKFVLKNIPQPGTYELIVSFVGYESHKIKLNVADTEIKLSPVRLTPSEVSLNTVEVTDVKDVKWQKDLKKFKKIFLGDDKEAEQCEIQNPWVIDFPKNQASKNFVAVAREPIHIRNIALGYKLTFYLKNFSADKTSYSISGNVRFEELKTDIEDERLQWLTNRRKSYLHSRQHLFKAMIDHRIHGEGFNLYTEVGSESATTRSAMFNSELDNTVIVYDTTNIVSRAPQKGIYIITLKGRVEIHYRKERARVRTYQDVYYPVSWIKLNKSSVRVTKDGFELNPEDVTVSGAMSSERVAHMLPLNYLPKEILSIEQEKKLELFPLIREQLYVHTDRPYYYPGETLWFKGYVNYSAPSMRDSLSRTAYVEVINDNKKITLSKIVSIDSGFFRGEFNLPDTLKSGNYYLRAYTNLQRNFGDGSLFIKYVPILTLTEKVVWNKPALDLNHDSTLIVLSDKTTYKQREKINLTIQTRDEEEEPVATHVSISVTDLSQVAPLEDECTILTRYPLKEIQNTIAKKDLPYGVEYGVNFSGHFFNAANKPEQALLNVIQLKPRVFTMAQSDEKGKFSVSGLIFYDTTEFVVQGLDDKNKFYGKAELLQRLDLPTFQYSEPNPQLPIVNTGTLQRKIPAIKTLKGVRQLDEVEVKAKRIADDNKSDFRIKRPYGKADYVLHAKDMNASLGNLLQILPGKFPGLVVRNVKNRGDESSSSYKVYILRSATSSISNVKEVTVLVNDVLINGSPADILGAIDPSSVETIELKTGINVLYGSLSGNGIVSIYTKTRTDEAAIKASGSSFTSMKVMGYSTPTDFSFPNYDDPKSASIAEDFRSLLYWNPNVKTNAESGTTSLSFFASDITGQYRVVAEGITSTGKPVRCVTLITVTKK